MAELGKIIAICLIGAVLTLLLEKSHPELAILLALSVCAGLLLFGLSRLGTVLSALKQLAQAGGLSSDLLQPLVKTVGIALVVKVGGGLCRDAGESALAAALEFAGTVCALLTALPLLRAVLELITELR